MAFKKTKRLLKSDDHKSDLSSLPLKTECRAKTKSRREHILYFLSEVVSDPGRY